MYRKKCLYCGKFSYRKNDHGKWHCPFCHHDLTGTTTDFFGEKKKLVEGYYKKIK